MSDFNFFLNRQGIQGRKGDKGDTGFTPTISVSEQTLNSYKLKITNEYNEFETPNLIGNLGVTDNGGTYLRYDPSTGTVSTGEIDGATTEVVGGVRKSTDADLTNLSADTAVTPANVADMLPLLLEAGTDNVTITQDEATSKTKISVQGGSGSSDVTAAGDNRFTGDNTFTGKVNIAGGALTVDGLATLNQATAQYLNAVSVTSSGEINAVSIKANGLRSDDIQTTENKKYLTELDVDNQTIQVVNGKLHANLDELGNEVNSLTGDVTRLTGDVNSLTGVITSLTGDVTDLTGRVTANEADISALKTGKQDKLTAGTGIKIENNVISNTQTSAEWGNIQGNITAQEDLQNTLNTKVDKVKGKSLILDTEIERLKGVHNYDDTQIKRDITNINSVLKTKASTTDLENGLKTKQDKLTFDTTPTVNSSNPVTSNGIKNELDKKVNSTTLTTELAKKQNKLKAGTNITLTDNPDGTTTVASTGGGGGGATIDDSTTATTSVWSSSKTNTEITTVANEVVQVQNDVASLDGDVSTLKTDVSGLKTDVSSLKTSKQDKLTAGDNITIDPETNTISATGGGSAPANMVTTDTSQTITGVKTFEDLKIKDLNAAGSTDIYANHGLVVTNNGEDTIIFRNTSYLETRHGEYANTATMRFGAYDASSNAQKISSRTNGSGSYGNLILEANSNNSDKSSLKLTKDSLTFTASDGTVTNLLTGGGSAPTNMVTTDTAQDITANKTFYGEIRVGADNNYATLAKFSKEALVSGSSTLSEHIDLGEADFVVQGNLGKKVYETDKYVYKKYINVDDLSDNQIAMDNTISSQVAHMAMPSDKYIDLTLGASGATYTAPADGWVYFAGKSNNANQYLHINNKNSRLETAFNLPASGQTGKTFIPAKKGDIIVLNYNTGSDKTFRFIYSIGSAPSS